ncbi:MAG: universal stress protein [Desulfobacteraceae bacterium]|nr:universal stress protein [Desulfobacteraceae bacterium]
MNIKGNDIVGIQEKGSTSLNVWKISYKNVKCSILQFCSKAHGHQSSTKGVTMTIKKIACCTDFSENAEAAFHMAVEMAAKYGASLSLIHVVPPLVNPLLTESEWPMPEENREGLVSKLEQRMHDKFAASVPNQTPLNIVVLDGHVSTEIVKFLEDDHTDMVVVGSYGLSGVELVFFGSVAKSIVNKAPCSVLIARKSVGNL